MPSAAVPADDARGFAGELRGLVRAAERRSGRKIDRASLAQVIHVSPQSLYAYLSGSRLPPAAVLDALLIELGASSGQLQRLAGMRDQVEESRRAGSRPGVPALRALPPDVVGFAGRHRELDDLNAALAVRAGRSAVAVMAITGPAGAGKTALAIHWAHQVANRFPDGLLHVGLRGSDPARLATGPGEILGEILEALGVPAKQIPASAQARGGLYRGVLAEQRILIVLDDARDAGQAGALIPASPASLVLVTSRDELTALTAAPGTRRISLDPVSQAIQASQDSGSPAAAGTAQSPQAADGRPGGTAILPATTAVPQVRYSLPADTAAFTGRDEELDLITAALAGAGAGGVVTVGAIDGMPGVGKTALAIHAAHVLAGGFSDRQLFVDLRGHTPGNDPVTAEDALAGLLTSVGVDPRYLPDDLAGRAAMWRDKMARQRALLVLDNAASSHQVIPLLPGSCCLVLVTSRRYLGDLPGAVTPVLLDVLAPPEAADMFTRLAPQAAGYGSGVAEVVALAGYLPLAVSLLARVLARHPSWTLADLAAETRAGLLTMTAEHDSVAAAFEVSYRHLHPDSQRLFRLLGVHPGAMIDRHAAAALAGTAPQVAAGLLDGLHREGLVTEAGHRRYGMHDLLRSYARDLAADAAESEQALSRLLDYYRHAAAVADARLAHQTRPGPAPPVPAEFEIPALDDALRALAWARADRANLVACLDLTERTGEHARVVALTAGLAAVLRRDGPWAEAITRHTTAAEAARHLRDRLCEANALTDLGDARQLAGDHLGAAGVLIEALGIYRDLGERLGEANALRNLGVVRRLTGDFPGAAQVLEEALRICRYLGERLGEANALRNLGAVRQMTGDYPGAAEVVEEALDIYRSLGERLGEAHALNDLGRVRQVTGDYPGAAEIVEEALDIYRSLGERLGEANALFYLGTGRQVTGDYPGAVQILVESLGIYRDLGERLGEANALYRLGDVRRVTGDYPGAVQILEESLGVYRDLGSRNGEADALNSVGAVRRLTGDYLGAAAAVLEALGIYRSVGDRQGQAEALNEQGALNQLLGDFARADECHQQALDLARAIGTSLDEANALAGLGRCAIAAGHATQAEAMLQQAHEIFQKIGAAEAEDVLGDLDALTRRKSTR